MPTISHVYHNFLFKMLSREGTRDRRIAILLMTSGEFVVDKTVLEETYD